MAEQVHHDSVVIYRFLPHGSKNINDLSPLYPFESWLHHNMLPQIYCNDQEPLNFDLYSRPADAQGDELAELVDRLCDLPSHNIRGRLVNLYDRAVLLHSEKNSIELDRYKQAGFVPAYYWSHAIIARDWFRYAEHVTQKKSIQKKFLIYNRAWTGTREYRLKFSDLLIEKNMTHACRTWCNPCDVHIGMHYSQYKFENSCWQPKNTIESFFEISGASSEYSADFDLTDYEKTNIEVVLETLFDDLRVHLTEKILRPIALAQPFILASTPNSLAYLRDYGFQTFGEVWDESYDLELDAHVRLTKIVDLIFDINSWDQDTRKNKMSMAQDIAEYNKKYFFSDAFLTKITEELSTNLKHALASVVDTNTGQSWLQQTKELLSYDEIRKLLQNPKHNLDASIDNFDYITNLVQTMK